jgi:hypothetical protein
VRCEDIDDADAEDGAEDELTEKGSWRHCVYGSSGPTHRMNQEGTDGNSEYMASATKGVSKMDISGPSRQMVRAGDETK